MAIKLYNTLTKTTSELTPLVPDTVSLYSCGPTVYDSVHIGNLSAFIAADILRRVVASHGLTVKHVMNFTDVDDKTIRRSREKYPDNDAMSALKQLTEEYGARFLDDMQNVGNDTAALTFIKATDDNTLTGMRQLITELYENGFAYVAEDGVYFSIDAYRKSGKVYGQLVDITDASTAHSRIQNDEYDKDSAQDFALWKLQKPGEPAWAFSLAGREMAGRPGWHIECSVMSRLELGQPFDIHTGGIDLTFPHHENEIAQSTAGRENPTYAGMFVHNEHILVDGKKMSKSANNFYTLTDLIKKGVDPLAFRLLVLQSHYRKQTNFSFDNAEAAHSRLQHWRAVAALRWQGGLESHETTNTEIQRTASEINVALADDLDTPRALQLIDALFGTLENTELSHLPRQQLTNFIETIDSLLGLNLVESTPDITPEIRSLIIQRQQAREAKDWNTSDDLRASLGEAGITINDTPRGTIWAYR